MDVQKLIDGLADYQKINAELDTMSYRTWDENAHLFNARDIAEQQIKDAIRAIVKEGL